MEFADEPSRAMLAATLVVAVSRCALLPLQIQQLPVGPIFPNFW